MKKPSVINYARKPRNIPELVHAWAHGLKEGQVGSVSCRDGKLYSYAACIAKIEGDVVIHSTRTWTPTTTQHQSLARQATHHMTNVWCLNPEPDALKNIDYVKRRIGEVLNSIPAPVMTKAGHEAVNSVKARQKLESQALHLATQANDYAEAFKTPKRKLINVEKLGLIAKQVERAERAESKREEIRRMERQKQQEEQQKERKENAVGALAKWRNYEGAAYEFSYLRELPPALRLSKDRTEIETSHRATIPVSVTQKLWKLIKHAKDNDTQDVMQFPENRIRLGHFTLNMIRADGSIVVGCHDIAFVEIEGIAKELGYV